MTYDTSAYRDSELLSQRTFFNKIFLTMAFGLLVTAGIAYWIALDPALMSSLFHLNQVVAEDGTVKSVMDATGWWFGAAALQLMIVIGISWFSLGRNMSAPIGLALFTVFAAANGITLAPVIFSYTAVSVAKVFLITSATFGGCALWGYVTKRDLTGLGGFFQYALIGMIVALLVNMFFSSPLMDYLVSGAGILLFAGLTAYDIQKLRKMHAEDGDHAGLVVYGALVFYLDFLNLFLFFMRLFGVKVGKD